MLDNASFDFCQ